MRFAIIFCLLACSACATFHETEHLSPGFLNLNAKNFDGESVEVTGWMIMDGHEMALWDQKSDRDSNINPGRCVSLLVPTDALDRIKPLSGSRVHVSGIFHKDIRGFFPLMFHNLCNISAVEIQGAEAVQF